MRHSDIADRRPNWLSADQAPESHATRHIRPAICADRDSGAQRKISGKSVSNQPLSATRAQESVDSLRESLNGD